MLNRLRIRRIIVLAALAGLCVPMILASCRKGEDDPFLSLKSRKKRITGSWKLKRCEVRGSYENPGPDDFNYVMTSEDGTFHWDFKGDTIEEPMTGAINLTLQFEKDGSFSVDEYMEPQTFKAKGNWDFLDGTGDAKNKERIRIYSAEVSEGSTNEYHPFMTVRRDVVFYIKELRSKHLVLTEKGTGFLEATGASFRIDAEYVFGR